jgi:DMSO reductase family type II enzyme chaperone
MMTTQNEKIAARSLMFQLLALGFAHPTEDFHRLLACGDFKLTLAQAASTWCGPTKGLPEVAIGFEDFEATYIQLFQVGRRGMPQVSLNAADHKALLGGESRPEFLLRYSSWYRHFGLKTAEHEGANELPDHVVCQLEFLCWLAHLECVATDESNARGYRLAQHDFLKGHLAPFLECLVVSLGASQEKPVGHFYQCLATLALESVENLLAEVEVDQDAGGRRETAAEPVNVVNLWG